jgi:hypothetical protein
MVWVEKDLAGVAKAVFDNWENRKDELRFRYLHAMDAVHTPGQVCEVIQRGGQYHRNHY